jgi:hypothetical protein
MDAREADENFHKKLMAAAQERLRVIAGNEEKLVEAWVAQHGFKPDECEIVRQDMQNGTVRMWVAKRDEFAKLRRFEEREPLVQSLLALSDLMRDAPVALVESVNRVRDFVLQPPNPALGPADKTEVDE